MKFKSSLLGLLFVSGISYGAVINPFHCTLMETDDLGPNLSPD
jgi:hypothetical protein